MARGNRRMLNRDRATKVSWGVSTFSFGSILTYTPKVRTATWISKCYPILLIHPLWEGWIKNNVKNGFSQIPHQEWRACPGERCQCVQVCNPLENVDLFLTNIQNLKKMLLSVLLKFRLQLIWYFFVPIQVCDMCDFEIRTTSCLMWMCVCCGLSNVLRRSVANSCRVSVDNQLRKCFTFFAILSSQAYNLSTFMPLSTSDMSLSRSSLNFICWTWKKYVFLLLRWFFRSP